MFELGPAGLGTSPHFSDPNPEAAQGSRSNTPNYAPTYFVNGQVNPIIEMRPSETQVWTLANVSPFAAYSMGIFKIGENGTIDPKAPLFRSTLIAQDGNDHFTPVRAYFIKQRDVNKDTYVAPGERMTFAITAPTESADYYLANVKDSAYTNQVSNLPQMVTFEPPGSYVPSAILATVRVTGEPVKHPAPEIKDEDPPEALANEPDLTRNISFDFDEHNLRGRINFGYFPGVAMAQSYSGDDERWVISTYSQVSHPFHIHQGQFVVEKIEYYEDQGLTKLRKDLPQNPVINDVPRDIDTFAFPGRSKAYIRLNASNFVGKFVMHCHLLLHEDSGMMVTVRVVPPREESFTALGAGPGKPPIVTLAHAVTGAPAGSFQAYRKGYRGGVKAEVGHILSGYKAFVVTSRRSGAPLVRVFDRTQLGRSRLDLVPFGGKGNGGSVALGDIDGDAIDEVLVGSGKGIKPAVAAYKIDGSPDGRLEARLLFEVPVLDDGYRQTGVHIAAADVDGDNWGDIIVANGPGAVNRVMVLSGQALSHDPNPKAAVIVDVPGLIPGTQGLNIAADNLAGGFFQYPPVTTVGMNPPAPAPFQSLIAVTPSEATKSPVVTVFYYMADGKEGQLHPVTVFTPFPGEKSPDEGLALSAALTIVADPNNPLVGLVSARDLDRQRVSFFTLKGKMETRPWAKQRP